MLIHLSAGGHLVVSPHPHFWAIVRSAAVNISVQILYEYMSLTLFGIYLEVEWLGHFDIFVF